MGEVATVVMIANQSENFYQKEIFEESIEYGNRISNKDSVTLKITGNCQKALEKGPWN
jgi:hypothetical protein